MAVLGAGPAGVAAAWRAARKGASVEVVERAPVPGGAAGSFTVGGMRVDHGSHRLHGSIEPAILAELRALMGPDLQERRRNGRIRLGGRWIAFPLRTGDLLRHLPPAFAARAAADALTAPLRRPRHNTFEDVVRAGLGPTMWRRFYEPYARKIWGMAPSSLSGEQARRRITADSPLKMVARVIAGSSGPATFFYPRTGFGTITECLAEAAAGAGARFRYSTAVEGLRIRDDGVEVALDDGSVVPSRRVWSTLPLTLLARMTDPAPPRAVLDAAAALRFRAMVLVYLVLDLDRWTAYDAHYLPEPTTPVTRVSEPKNYRDGNDPAGRTVLCAEIPCDPGDDVWATSDHGLAAVVAEGLEAQGLPPPRPVNVVVRRLSHAYPVYTADYERHFGTLDAWATQQPRVLTFGRQGLFAHDNTHHAFAMAWAAADALQPDGGFDDRAWTAARERFAAHVVDD
ncbi:MAG: FAD-dependent oxidoreductase [Nitriliruptorales bacterium]|nr:FAD-dependent oxidoreductase [Nitriliruptorales bacterium]